MNRHRGLLALAASVPALAWAAGAEPPAPGEDRLARGHQLYVEGSSPAGEEVIAVLGDGGDGGEGIEVPAVAVPCAGCHGRDGRGRPEGGLTPTDITWSRLSRPYGAEAPGGRRHPPYDAATLERSLLAGVDPAGTPLHPAMPRYRMSRRDLDDLVAYLTTLGEAEAPGVTAEAVAIGVVPPAAPGPAAAVRAALAARVEEFHRQGGSWGRRVELRFLAPAGPPGERRVPAADRLVEDEPFAVLAPLPAGGTAALAALCGARRIPLLVTFPPADEGGVAIDRYVFSLLPGLAAQGRALVRLARESAGAGPPRPVLLAPQGARLDAAVAAVRAAASGWAEVGVHRYGRGRFAAVEVARGLAAADADPVLFLGTGEEALALLRAAVPLAWRPRLLAAGPAGPALLAAPEEFAGRLFAVLPAPPHLDAAAAARHRALAASAGLGTDHLASQILALAAAEVVLEALIRAGRNLDRETFVATLESLHRYEAAYLPPLTFGPSRRDGARGAYLARVDLAARTLAPAGGWIELP